MFLNDITIQNIQSRLVENRIFFDDVKIKAVYCSRNTVIARYVLNGDDVVSYIDLDIGAFVADELSASIRNRDYYRFSDIEAGYEKDDSVDKILAVWPLEIETTNVVLIKPAVTVLDEDEDDDTQPAMLNSGVDLSVLGNKFNITRRRK